jgi:hypothetical protein
LILFIQIKTLAAHSGLKVESEVELRETMPRLLLQVNLSAYGQ